MGNSNSPDLAHVDFNEQATEFPDEVFANGERHTLSGFGNNQNNADFSPAAQPFIRITNHAFGDAVSTPHDVECSLQTQPNQHQIYNAIADQDDDSDCVEDKHSMKYGERLCQQQPTATTPCHMSFRPMILNFCSSKQQQVLWLPKTWQMFPTQVACGRSTGWETT
ncbi:MAG: hypothetical protein ABJH63_15950 [Rhizobiaceae bacterium]